MDAPRGRGVLVVGGRSPSCPELPLVALSPIRGRLRLARSVFVDRWSWLVQVVVQMRKSRNRFKSQNRGTNEEVSKSFQNRFDFETI